MKLYIDVPYQEKDEAKALGAKWNPKVKKWYINVMQEDYINFSKWILKKSDEVIIATENLYIIEGTRKCWKCGNETKVIGLGIGDYICIYGEPEDAGMEIVGEGCERGEELHLAWVDKEEDIPPKILRYIKSNYSVKTSYSNTMNSKCFSNHCSHCDALQGNWFLFNEPDSPLSCDAFGEELVERMKKLVIKEIHIRDDLQLNWNMDLGSNNYAYFEYATIEELNMCNDPEEPYAPYEDLYDEA